MRSVVSALSHCHCNAEAIKKGTVLMSVWMYVIREMEDALDDCKEECETANCNEEPVLAWDEAVAFYTGSLEGKDGSGSGVLLYALADDTCADFATCGDLASETSGTSHVNLEIFRQFQDGQRKLVRGECSAARANKERIEKLMAVPLIQGTLRYAYITDKESVPGERAEAEGAVFAASVLPIVYACDEDAAETIYKNMRVGQNGTANFEQVKKAFEKNYECMGVRCQDVGGIYDSLSGGYLASAAPCGSDQESRKDVNVGLAVGISLGGVVAIAVMVFLFSGAGRNSPSARVEPKSVEDVEGVEGVEGVERVEYELKAEGAVIS
jgi:hypothetical protein